MQIDLFLPMTITRIKQLLNERHFLRNARQEIQSLYETDYPTGSYPSTFSDNSDQIEVYPQDAANLEISVLSPNSTEDILDISILNVERTLTSASYEAQDYTPSSSITSELDIEVLSEGGGLNQADIETYNESPTSPSTGEVVEVLDNSLNVSLANLENSNLQGVHDIFDENSTEARLLQIKSEIEDIKQQIGELKQSQNQLAVVFSSETELFEQQHLRNLGEYDQQIQAAERELARQTNVQSQISQDLARLQEAQQRNQQRQKLVLGIIVAVTLVIGIGLTASFYLLPNPGPSLPIWAIGVWVIVVAIAGILYYVLETNLTRNSGEVFLLASAEVPLASRIQQLRIQHEQEKYGYQQQRNTREATYQEQQQSLSHQLANIYHEAVNILIPEGESLIINWLKHLATILQKLYPAWEDPYWKQININNFIQQQDVETSGLRIGTLVHEELLLPIPAVITPIQDRRHIFIKGGSDDQQTRNLQAAVLRLLAAFPKDLVRITVIDAVELGHHTLASLATKLPEKISGGSVKYLEQDITTSLEQLRSTISHIKHYVLVEHSDINNYNQAYPEVPTPFHFIIIHNFPVGFTGQALRVLRDIVRTGPSVGMYILSTIADPLPDLRDFDITDFTANSFMLHLQNDGFLRCSNSLLEDFVIKQDNAPQAALFLRILNTICEAYDKNPLVLRYERIKKELPSLWSIPTFSGLQSIVGLTFSGKVHKIEFNDEFVSGLVGGRPGSGKTILLHNLICGLAQTHAPSELDLYLLDFAGTELNVYARYQLPHARAIAVDCDPEIGLSIINNLIGKMVERIKRFSDADVSSFREYRKKFPLPRILLVIDEIHVLTQQSDDVRMANQVSNKLVDLLKRGRKYGIHVLLVTQSPSNVLSKEMLQQVAIRVCLLADSSVSRLVLGETNEAASRLEKQGEAVYNAYNGDPKKNEFIRVALMEREYIAPLVQNLAAEAHNRNDQSLKELFYFDGQRRIILLDTPLIQMSLSSKTEPIRDGQVIIPLGESISNLGHYTLAEFGQQRYSNMIIVGDEIEQLYTVWGNVILALCIQQSCGSARFYVIDLSPSILISFNVTPVFQEVMPHEFQIARQALMATEFIKDLSAELNRRREEAQQGFTPEQTIFLLVFSIENFTSMRGSTKFDKTEARKQLEEILKEGPALGIHTVVATQTLARGEILDANEFTFRVCFSVGENDSRSLLDTDTATKLRRSDRGIYRRHNWQIGRVDKFKPYLPTKEQDIREVAKRLVNRVKEGTSQ